MNMAEEEKPVRDPEGLAAHQAAAVWANRIYIYSDGAMVRLVFADQGAPDWPPTVRSAVAMHPQSAIEFAKALRNILTPIEEALQRAQQAAAVPPTTEKKDG
jgi:hypothetical protein